MKISALGVSQDRDFQKYPLVAHEMVIEEAFVIVFLTANFLGQKPADVFASAREELAQVDPWGQWNLDFETIRTWKAIDTLRFDMATALRETGLY